MTSLTKEYFDQHMKRIDNRFDSVEKKIEKKIEDEIHNLAAITAKGFEDIIKRLDVRERVDQLERKMTKVESALNVQL